MRQIVSARLITPRQRRLGQGQLTHRNNAAEPGVAQRLFNGSHAFFEVFLEGAVEVLRQVEGQEDEPVSIAYLTSTTEHDTVWLRHAPVRRLISKRAASCADDCGTETQLDVRKMEEAGTL